MRLVPDGEKTNSPSPADCLLAAPRAEDVLYRNDIGAMVRVIVQDNASTPYELASCEAGLAKLPNFLKLKAVR